MTKGEYQKMYHEKKEENFPETLEVKFVWEDGKTHSLIYEKVTWEIEGEKESLRYGENPSQPAAMYKLKNSNLIIGEVVTIRPNNYLASDPELLQSGKHPGKINITDVDNALNIIRYFHDEPACAIMKHNNPSGVALGKTLEEAYTKANLADRIAAFGGAVAMNRAVDKATAEAILENYVEVVCAPEYEEGVLALFEKKKNLRILRIDNILNLHSFVGKKFVDFKSLIDGGLILQLSYTPKALTKDDLKLGEHVYKGKEYKIKREPTKKEYEDMIFGWLVESGVTSNSVIFVKDKATVAIGTGEQDRVGVAKIAVFKAYEKYADRLAWECFSLSYEDLKNAKEDINTRKAAVDATVKQYKAGIKGSIMVSDAFFPFKDGVEVGIEQGITGIVQPGGSERDFESIEACNKADITMVFTGERSFKH